LYTKGIEWYNMPVYGNGNSKGAYLMKTGMGSKIIGIVLFFLVILMALFIGGGQHAIAIFTDIPSLLFVTLIPLSMSLLAGLTSDYLRSFKIVFGGSAYSINECKASSIAMSLMIKLVYLSGFIGSLIGFVQLLRYLDNPLNIGPALSVVVLTLFYALIFNVLQHSMKAKIDKEIASKE